MGRRSAVVMHFDRKSVFFQCLRRLPLFRLPSPCMDGGARLTAPRPCHKPATGAGLRQVWPISLWCWPGDIVQKSREVSVHGWAYKACMSVTSCWQPWNEYVRYVEINIVASTQRLPKMGLSSAEGSHPLTVLSIQNFRPDLVI